MAAEIIDSINNGLNIKVEVNPFSAGLYSLNSLHIYEEIGGLLPYGTAEFMITKYEPAKKFMKETIEGEIIISKDKSSYKIPIIITTRQVVEVKFIINFIIAPSITFYTEKKIETFNNINSAIKILTSSFRKSDIDLKSNVNPTLPIYKDYSTRYNFLKKLAMGYKNDTIFGFSFDGFFIKKIKSDKVNNLPIILGAGTTQISAYSNKVLNKNQDNNNPEIVNEISSSNLPNSINYKIVSNYNNNGICFGGKYDEMGKNYVKNSTFIMNAKTNVTKITNFSDLPSYKLGDNVYTVDSITKTENISKKLNLVWSNEVFIRFNGSDYKSKEGKPFNWTTTLVNLDKSPWNTTN